MRDSYDAMVAVQDGRRAVNVRPAQEVQGSRIVPAREVALRKARPQDVQWVAHVWASGTPNGKFSVYISGDQYACTAEEFAAKDIL